MQADPHNPSNTKNNTLIVTFAITLAIILALILLAGAMYLFNKQSPISETVSPIVAKVVVDTEVIEQVEEQPEVNSAQEDIQVVEEPTPVVIEEAPIVEEIQLPSLDQSDVFTFDIIKQLSPSIESDSLFIKEDMIRNFVVFIENLSQGELLHKFSPVVSPINKFSVLKQNEQLYLDPRSYHRFDNYVNLFYHLDANTSVAQYHLLSPLFEQVYEEVGYPSSTFEQSLNNAIDSLLAAPTITQPIKLVLPSVMYKFADPKLEALPAAQKLMIRMGPENTLKLKTKLQQIKTALAE